MLSKGKRVVVTGGGEDIGRAIAEAFVAENVQVCVFDINPDQIYEINKSNVGMRAMQGDVSMKTELISDAAALRHLLDFLRRKDVIPAEKISARRLTPVEHHAQAYEQHSMTSIPRAIATDQVHRLLVSIDRRTAIGRRDYAILLLLARLGLRSSEVVFLELDDIDWNAGRLNVRGKSNQRSELPLPAEVGKAIAAYLRSGRPNSTSRRVFLRTKAPIRGFRGASGVGSMVRHALQRAGIDAPTYSAHQFRHGLATEMLRQGASLAEIGEVLGHRHPQTTKI